MNEKSEFDSLRIIGFEAENVKRIKAVSIKPEGSTVKLAGQNEQGKTSCIDAIWWALGGTRNIQEEPIREGETKARAFVDLGELRVTRTWNKKGTTLKVEDKLGNKKKSPQTILDDLISKLAFDPLAFLGMDAKAQADTLRELVGLDFTKLDEKRKRLYDQRTDSRKDAAESLARAEAITFPEETPDEPVDADELTKRLEEINESNAQIDRMEDDLGRRQSDIEGMENDHAKLVNQLAELEKAILANREQHAKATSAAKLIEGNLGGLIRMDATPVIEQRAQVQAINDNVARKHAKAEALDEFRECEDYTGELTTQINAIDEEKKTLMSSAEWPIKGLGFREEGVTFEGLPIDQASSARQYEIGIGMGAAMNPKLPIMFIRHGALLDDKHLATVEQIAADKGCQVWIEIATRNADDTVAGAVMIEDGEVVSGS